MMIFGEHSFPDKKSKDEPKGNYFADSIQRKNRKRKGATNEKGKQVKKGVDKICFSRLARAHSRLYKHTHTHAHSHILSLSRNPMVVELSKERKARRIQKKTSLSRVT